MALATFDVWNDKGAAQFHYSPITNYQNPPDLHINNGTIPFIKNGTHYYLSHPPMGFWLPYYSFKILKIEHNTRNLQFFNLLFHLLAALCVFSITKTLLLASSNHSTFTPTSNNQRIQQSHTPPIIATGIYLFSPAMLWYGSNVYFSDIFVNQLFIITIWAGLIWGKHLQLHLKKTVKTSKSSPPPIRFYGKLLFFMVMLLATLLTEWIGYFLAASIFIYTIRQLLQNTHRTAQKWYFVQSTLVVIIGVGGLIITFGTYSQILGFDAYLDYFLNRFLTRTGQMDNGVTGINIGLFYAKQLVQHYVTSFLPVLLLLIFLLIKYWRSKKDTGSQPLMKKNRHLLWSYFFWVALPPIFLHHFLFINYTAIHEYAIVKVALPLAILSAYLAQRIIQNQTIPIIRLKIILFFVFAFCLLQYYYINRPGTHSWKGHRYDQFQQLGVKIQQQAKSDEMVFVKGTIEINFQLVYYAKRNIWKYQNPEQMEKTLKHFGQEKGVVIEVKN